MRPLLLTLLAALAASPAMASISEVYQGTGYTITLTASDFNTDANFTDQDLSTNSSGSLVLTHADFSGNTFSDSVQLSISIAAGYSLVSASYADISLDASPIAATAEQPTLTGSHTYSAAGAANDNVSFSDNSLITTYGGFGNTVGSSYVLGANLVTNDWTSSNGITGLTLNTNYLIAVQTPGQVLTDNTGYSEFDFLVLPTTPVPEPETWALMGLGCVGVLARLRRRKAAQAPDVLRMA